MPRFKRDEQGRDLNSQLFGIDGEHDCVSIVSVAIRSICVLNHRKKK